ncbi:MAG: enoyl-CoA hydratase-related protein, partial [Candidatus Binataceae bacterium]
LAPKEKVVDTATELARRLIKMPPLALRSAKMLVHTAVNADLKTGIEAERQAMGFLFDTHDRDEGMNAFLQKREATFKGR